MKACRRRTHEGTRVPLPCAEVRDAARNGIARLSGPATARPYRTSRSDGRGDPTTRSGTELFAPARHRRLSEHARPQLPVPGTGEQRIARFTGIADSNHESVERAQRRETTDATSGVRSATVTNSRSTGPGRHDPAVRSTQSRSDCGVQHGKRRKDVSADVRQPPPRCRSRGWSARRRLPPAVPEAGPVGRASGCRKTLRKSLSYRMSYVVHYTCRSCGPRSSTEPAAQTNRLQREVLQAIMASADSARGIETLVRAR